MRERLQRTIAEASDQEARAEFRRVYTRINLRRVRWVLACSLFFNMAAALIPAFRTMTNPSASPGGYLLLLPACAAMWAAVEWALRAGASERDRERVAAVYYVFGCLTAGVLYWLNHFGPCYWCSLFAFGMILILPPRRAFPLLAAAHLIFLAEVFLYYGDTERSAQEAVLATLFLGVTGYISAALHAARWQDFLKERTILRQIQELETANTEMADLMAITAHNLGSPLQSQANLLELARVKAVHGENRAHLDGVLEAASRSCAGMIALVRRLLEAHAAEHAGNETQPVATDLVPRFIAAIERAGPLANAKGMTLALDLPPSKSLIGIAQPDLLDDVLDNLLGNAVKYAPRGTTVTLALSGANGVCHGTVRDEGPGIPETEQPHLFSKFFVGHSKPTGGETSTGLGLFIVRKLMEGMGGRAGHEPGTPKGSVFWIEMPGEA